MCNLNQMVQFNGSVSKSVPKDTLSNLIYNSMFIFIKMSFCFNEPKFGVSTKIF